MAYRSKLNITSGKKLKAFTLIELLLVIAIMAILAAAAVPIYGNLQVSSQLNENSAQIVQALRTAQSRSIAGLNDEIHGVKFYTNRYILFQGSPGNDYDREVVLTSPPLSISTTLAGNTVTFSKGLGVPDNTGYITLTHDVTGNRTITISEIGTVEEQ